MVSPAKSPAFPTGKPPAVGVTTLGWIWDEPNKSACI